MVDKRLHVPSTALASIATLFSNLVQLLHKCVEVFAAWVKTAYLLLVEDISPELIGKIREDLVH